MAYTPEQRKVQRKIIRIGQKRGMPRKAILSALATGAVESNWRNLDYGDRDSQGWRQERAQYYSNPRNLNASVNRYYDEWKADAPKRGPIGPMAQAVQQSAFPERYQEFAGQAADILNAYNRKGGGRGRRRSGSATIRGATLTQSSSVPGIDNSALRQQVMMSYLDQRGQPGALLGLASGLEGAQDIPGATLTSTDALPGVRGQRRQRGGVRGGRDVVTATGRSVNKMLKMAEKWDRVGPSYLWGGGHSRIAKPGEPVDCSGFVSAIIGLDSPQVSGNLASWGKPGKGRWLTVYANDGHTLLSLRDPRTKKVRWFGTSRSNAGGGAGEIPQPDAAYLSRFTARHPG